MRKIDDTQPLNDDDRAWLVSRNMHYEIRRIDEMHGVEHTSPETIPPALSAALPTNAGRVETEGDIAMRRVIAWLDEHDVEDPDIAEDDAQRVIEALTGLLSVDDPDADEEDADDDDDDEDEPVTGTPYDGMTVGLLRDELGKRELSKSGTKAELLARLIEADQE